MIVLGQSALERSDGLAVLEAVRQISKSTPIVNKVNGWNGFNILHKEASRVGALDLGLYSKPLNLK